MNIRPPYIEPASNRRPYGAFRFDVASLKAQRRITVYGLAAFQGWVELEADPGVDRLCERPVVIRDAKPQRVVDFWASGPGRSELIFLMRKGELSGSRAAPINGGFETWASDIGCTIRHVEIERPTPAKQRWLDGWTQVLQYVNAYQPYVTPSQIQAVQQLLQKRCSLRSVLQSADIPDLDVARAAVYLLIYRGTHRFVGLESKGLDDDIELEPT